MAGWPKCEQPDGTCGELTLAEKVDLLSAQLAALRVLFEFHADVGHGDVRIAHGHPDMYKTDVETMSLSAAKDIVRQREEAG